MPDIAIVPVDQPDIISLDWLLTPTNLIAEEASLISAVTVAICTDALAQPNDVPPDPNNPDRRGWWGDTNAAAIWGGWPVGSRVWLLSRAKILDQFAREGATVTRIQSYVQECLQPFIGAGICSRVTVTAAQTGPARIVASATIYRGPKAAITLQYAVLWDELKTA
mgnify:CR=1 FL=1